MTIYNCSVSAMLKLSFDFDIQNSNQLKKPLRKQRLLIDFDLREVYQSPNPLSMVEGNR